MGASEEWGGGCQCGSLPAGSALSAHTSISPFLLFSPSSPCCPPSPPRLQAALAALSGIQDVPEPRSLLTMEEGIQTLQMMSQMGRISRPSHIRCVNTQQQGWCHTVVCCVRLRAGAELS